MPARSTGWVPAAIFTAWVAALAIVVTPLVLGTFSGAVGQVMVAALIVALLLLVVVAVTVPLISFRRSSRVELALAIDQVFDAIAERRWALAVPGLRGLTLLYRPLEGKLVETGTRLVFSDFIRLEGGLPEFERPRAWTTRHRALSRRWTTQGRLSDIPAGTQIEVVHEVRVPIGVALREWLRLDQRRIDAGLRRMSASVERGQSAG
jgi:hypothetical protein